MKVRVVLDLEVGESPVADAITYFVARDGVALGDDMHSVPEWVESVVASCIGDTVEQPCYGLGWCVLTSTSQIM
jgi:hypothetical protein